jgi:hypothetical protein
VSISNSSGKMALVEDSFSKYFSLTVRQLVPKQQSRVQKIFMFRDTGSDTYRQ